MKSSIILGIVFLAIGGILAYLQNNESQIFLTLNFIIGILIGAGFGILLGAIIGYSSKAKNVKKKNNSSQVMPSQDNTNSPDI